MVEMQTLNSKERSVSGWYFHQPELSVVNIADSSDLKSQPGTAVSLKVNLSLS
jgi:hypothetical protein